MLTTAELHLCCVVKALFVATSRCYIGSMCSTALLERVFVDLLLVGDPHECSFSCLSQKGQTWSLPSNGSALFYSPVQWINLQSKGLPPYEILWAQFQLWAYNLTELKHFCTQLRCNKWQLLQFNLPPVDTAWIGRCTLNSCSFREFAKGCPAIPCNPQWTFSVFAKWIIVQSSKSRHSELMLEYSWSLDTYSHLSWTLVNFEVGHQITSHFEISKLASGCSHTAAVPPANKAWTDRCTHSHHGVPLGP